MAHFAIMRCKKLAKMGNLAASLQHAYRERETLNADPSKTPDNSHRAAKSTSEAMGRVRELLPEKRRKDAVLAVEYVFTASPEWWSKASQEKQTAFFDQAQAWLSEKYGKQNIVTASIHRDELSPHMTAFVVPITQDGRLSAFEFIGNKAKMTKDQSSFASSVAHLGLQRGIEGSKATHQRVKSFYSEIQKEAVLPVITAEDLKPKKFKEGFLGKLGISATMENDHGVAERLTQQVQAQVLPVYETALKSRSEAARASELTKEAKESIRVKNALIGGLNAQEQKRLFDLAEQIRQERKEALLESFKNKKAKVKKAHQR